VLVAVVVGARVFAGADRATDVYVAAHALVPGERVVAADLTVGWVRFHGQGGSYVAASRTAPVGYLVTRYVGAHELVPLSALAARPGASLGSRLVTVPVQPGHLPVGLGHGDLVDVYLTPKPTGGGPVGTPKEVLAGAPVDSTDGGARSLGGSTSVSVVLAVPVAVVGAVVHAVESGTIDLVEVPPAVAALAPSPAAGPGSSAPTGTP
jgi:hypothetical protein